MSYAAECRGRLVMWAWIRKMRVTSVTGCGPKGTLRKLALCREVQDDWSDGLGVSGRDSSVAR
jgi:hypothetical protein